MHRGALAKFYVKPTLITVVSFHYYCTFRSCWKTQTKNGMKMSYHESMENTHLKTWVVWWINLIALLWSWERSDSRMVHWGLINQNSYSLWTVPLAFPWNIQYMITESPIGNFYWLILWAVSLKVLPGAFIINNCQQMKQIKPKVKLLFTGFFPYTRCNDSTTMIHFWHWAVAFPPN